MYAIRTTALTKRYPDTVAVANLDLTVEPGEVFGLVGPNGAGKSTTIALILGLCRPTSGEARVFEHDAATSTAALRARVGAVPERGGLFDRLSGRRHLAFVADGRSHASTPSSALDRVGLRGAGDRRVSTYSTGMRQRLRLAIALVGRPDVLVLDEPGAGLDPGGIARLRKIVRSERDRGSAILLSSHQLGAIGDVCDRVGFIFDGSLREVRTVDEAASIADRYASLAEASR